MILEPKKIKSVTDSIISPSICHEVMGLDATIFIFCHEGGDICISKAFDVSSGNLDSSLCFIQPSISHDVHCIQVELDMEK